MPIYFAVGLIYPGRIFKDLCFALSDKQYSKFTNILKKIYITFSKLIISGNLEEQNIHKTILMAAGIIAASVIFSALIVKMDFGSINVTSHVAAIVPKVTTTTTAAATTVATTAATTTTETTTTKSSHAVCKAPCFDYFEFVSCEDGTLILKNGASAITVSSVSGGTHVIKNNNPSYMPRATITIDDVPTTGNQEININYWMDNIMKLDVATIIN